MTRRCVAYDQITLPFPPDMVWKALTDFKAYPLWWPSTVTVHVLQATPEVVGSKIELEPRNGKRLSLQVAACVPQLSMHMAYVGGVYLGAGLWQLEAVAKGTQLSYAVDLEIRSRLVALISYVLDIPAVHSRLMRHIFDGLLQHLERQPAQPTVHSAPRVSRPLSPHAMPRVHAPANAAAGLPMG